MQTKPLISLGVAAFALSPPLAAKPLQGLLATRAAQRGPNTSLIDIAELSGRWRVTGVALMDGPVQAFVPNDPAYMGRVLTITSKRLSWAATAPGQATLSDVCADPATQRLPAAAATNTARRLSKPLAALAVPPAHGHEIACLASGTWGPEAAGGATLFAASLNRIAFTWYDGVVLRLDRLR